MQEHDQHIRPIVNTQNSGEQVATRMQDDELLVSANPFILENDFRTGNRPLAAHFYAAFADGYRSRSLRKIIRRFARLAFQLTRKTKRFTVGSATVRHGQGRLPFLFNAANTQFQSLYLARFDRGYEPETTALLKLLCQGDGAFFDIGANWGYFATLIALSPHFRGQVVAFEPSQDTFADLSSTVAQLDLTSRITCLRTATSDRTGCGRLTSPDGLHSGVAMLTNDERRGESVDTIALDEADLPSPAIIKLDVEGAEYQTLLGARRILSEERPFLVFETWSHHKTSRPTLDLLEAHGYKLFQPCLMAKDEDGFRAVNTEIELGEISKAWLALMPFATSFRPMLQPHFNAFACPTEKMSDLRSLLGVSLGSAHK